MGGGSKTTVVNQVDPPTPQELEGQRLQLELMKKQLDAFDKQLAFNTAQQEALSPLIKAQGEYFSRELEKMNDPVQQQIDALGRDLQLETLQRAQRLGPLEEQLIQSQIEEMQRGGRASPEQEALIDEYTQGTIDLGRADVLRNTNDLMDMIRESAASRGMRPSDTPIVDRGNLLAREALRQTTDIETAARTAGAEAKLNYPLKAGELSSVRAQGQQNVLAGFRDFQANLQDLAARSRANLLGGLGQNINASGGLGSALAGINAGFTVFPKGSTQTTRTRQSMGIGDILSSVGAVAGAFAMSSKDAKDREGGVDDDAALEAIEKLPVDKWSYKGEEEGHIGTYAEDFNAEMGTGKEHPDMISMIDMHGAEIAAIQALARQLRELKGAIHV